MPDTPEEIRQSKRKILRLSPAEYQYLKYGDVSDGYVEDGTERTDKLNSEIKDRLDLLPQRFNLLFEDVDLLSQMDYDGLSSTDAWIECWLRLLGITLDTPLSQDELTDQLTYRTIYSADRSAPEKFGEKIGDLLWNLFSLEPPGVELDEIFQNVIWGVIVGVAHQISDDPAEFKLEIVKEFQNRAQLESKITESRSVDIEVPDKDREQAIYDRIIERLEADKKISDSLLRPDASGETEEKRSEEVARPWIAHALAELIAEEEPLMTDWLYGGDTVDWSPADTITSELISEFLEEHRLIEKQRLFEMLAKDTKRIKAKHGKGPTASQILNCVATEDGRISSTKIAKQLNKTKDWSSGVTELARDLAGHRDPDEYDDVPRDIWSDHPILKGSKDGWEATPYGEALNCCLENQKWGSQSQHPPVPKTVLEAAIDDVILS